VSPAENSKPPSGGTITTDWCLTHIRDAAHSENRRTWGSFWGGAGGQGEVRLTQYELIMQHWIASDSKLPMIVLIIQQLPYPLSLLKSWFFDFFGSSKITFLPHWNRSVFPTFFSIFWFVYLVRLARLRVHRRVVGIQLHIHMLFVYGLERWRETSNSDQRHVFVGSRFTRLN